MLACLRPSSSPVPAAPTAPRRLRPAPALGAALLAALASACAQPAALDGDDPPSFISEGAALRSVVDAGAALRWAPPAGLRYERVALRWDAAAEGTLRVRPDGDSDWTPVRTTFAEGPAHNGHADLRVAASGPFELAWDGPAGALTWVYAEVRERPLPATPAATRAEPVARVLRALGPAGLVGTRAQWGARSVSCNSPHDPNRVSIHHTDTPTNDSVSAEARLRQIQAFHIDDRGWCDIGYHFLVSRDGRVWQGRDERHIGAHVANENTDNIGISYIGNYMTDQPTDTQLCNGAKLFDWISDTYRIPRDRAHVKGHREQGQTSCPGDALFARLSDIISRSSSDCTFDGMGGDPVVGGGDPGAGTGTLVGVVYEAPDTAARLPGARVTLDNGDATTADSSGVYRFTVPAGTYTATAVADGYAPASVTRDVAVGEQRWGSIGLVPGGGGGGVRTGVLKGVVFIVPNINDRIPGARVTVVGGPSLDVDAQGLFTFTLEAGSYTVRAEAPGYKTVEVPRDVAAGADTWGSIGLERADDVGGNPGGGDPGGGTTGGDAQVPRVQVTSPADGDRVSASPIEVTGTVTDDVGVVSVSVNGVVASLTAGRFRARVDLVSGSNTLTVEARDAVGNVGRARVGVLLSAAPGEGTIAGFVFDSTSGRTARIEGVSVWAAGGDEVLTGADGQFELGRPAGTYRVRFRADGYATQYETVTVGEGATVNVEVGLEAGGSADDREPPEVQLAQPLDGDHLVGPTVTARVHATDDAGIVEVTVNGVRAQAVDADLYEALVPLHDGAVTLTAIAFDAAGNRGQHRVSVTVEGAGDSGGDGDGGSPAGGGGGCSASGGGGGGLTLGAVLLALVALRRRRAGALS